MHRIERSFFVSRLPLSGIRETGETERSEFCFSYAKPKGFDELARKNVEVEVMPDNGTACMTCKNVER